MDHGRFWLPIVPLLYGAAAAFTVGGGERVALRVARVSALVVAVGGLAVAQDRAFDPAAPRSRPSDWLGEDFVGSEFVATLRDLDDCTLLANEPRFALLWVEPRPVAPLPFDRRELRRLVRETPDACVVQLRRRLPGSVRAHRKDWEVGLRDLVRRRELVVIHSSALGAVYTRRSR